ncbi:hypothetical protein FOHLNKBM_3377 [Methylobacterium longum]|jgi:hypothetical protein|nr:hypothetical protein FOHLNKBM_3377 [Methylobacterium longum]
MPRPAKGARYYRKADGRSVLRDTGGIECSRVTATQ